MPDVDLHKSPAQWGAIIAAATLFWLVIWGVGSQFRDHLLSDVRGLIAAHADTASANRTEFFKDIESEAHRAIGRIGDMERNCAVVQKQLVSIEERLDGLGRWRDECSQKMAGVQQYMARDSADIRDLEQDVMALREEIRKRK